MSETIMIKAFISDPRCLTLNFKSQLQSVSRETRFDADIFILYQDYLNIEKIYMDEAILHNIPVLVIQHGRQATRDYSKEGRDLRADKICLWGTIDCKRMRGLGYPKDKLVLTGSPLMENITERIMPDIFLKTKTILFTVKYFPYVIEPNYTILRNLMKTPHNIIIKTIRDDKNIDVYQQFKDKYGDRIKIIATSPKGDPKGHISELMKALEISNIVVGIDESIIELMATAMNIPVIMVKDAWIPKDALHFNGIHDIKKDGLMYSRASYKTRMKDVARKVEGVLKFDSKSDDRREVAIEEGGYGLPTSELIMDEIKKLVNKKEIQNV